MLTPSNMLKWMGWMLLGLAVGVVLSLAGCGGGPVSSGSAGQTSTSTGTDATHGALTLGLSGGGVRGIDHVWVQVTKVALHAQVDQAWSSTDSSWTVLQLSTPVAVDLAAVSSSTNSDVTRVFTGLSVPAGSYAQMRLFVLPHEGALSDVATAQGLQYNAQLNYTDGNGTARVVPLELPQTELGLRVAGTFTITAGVSSYQVLQLDLAGGLARTHASDGVDRFGLRPRLRAYDMSQAGAIIGHIDPSLLCGGAGAAADPACASDVLVSAQTVSDDGLRHESVRRYKVDSSGGFALYPLPNGTRFDVVITGRHMRPMVIQDVPVTPFDATSDFAWTVLGGSTALPPTIESGTAATVSLATSASPQAAALYWGQTVSSPGVPYEWLQVALDPYTGLLAQPVTLPQGPVMVAPFVLDSSSSSTSITQSAALTFTATVPVEGSGAFSLITLGTAYDQPSAAQVVTPPAGTSSTVTAAASVRRTSLASGTLTVSVSGSLSANFDTVQVIVSDVQGVVMSQTFSGNPGSVAFTVPVGADAAALGGTAIYSVAVRASGASGALSWARATAAVDLRSASSGSATVTLP